jgi:hypothetical protein
MRLFSRFPEVDKGLRPSRLLHWAKTPKAILSIGLVALFLYATGRDAVLSPTTAKAGQEDVDKLANPLVLYLPFWRLQTLRPQVQQVAPIFRCLPGRQAAR